MQVFVFFCIVLCLVVDANTRSVTDIDGEKSVEDLSQFLTTASGENSDEDFCNPNPCKNSAMCLKSIKKCHCNFGYSGVFCEKCICFHGFCKEVNNGDSVCTCPPEWGLYESISCKRCRCGKESNCTFDSSLENNGKKCLCRVGYEDRNGTCVGTCNMNPCLNGGECLEKGTDIECRCKIPFVGELCEKKEVTVDPCTEIICENNGTCREHDGRPKCECLDRFSGKFCEIDVCSPNPCKNGGFCNATSNGVSCQCRDRFKGADCSIDVCSPNPCRNGGNCTATSEGVTCECREGFKGADCSIEIPFPPTSTSVSPPTATRNLTSFWTHLPTANETNNFTRTIGPSSWTFFPTSTSESSSGDHSSNFTDEVESTARYSTSGPTTGTDPCDWNPCKNGGVCKTENETVSCYCKDPFAGEFCESRIKMGAYVIILVAVTVFLAVVLIFVTCVLCKRYQGTRTS